MNLPSGVFNVVSLKIVVVLPLTTLGIYATLMPHHRVCYAHYLPHVDMDSLVPRNNKHLENRPDDQFSNNVIRVE